MGVTFIWDLRVFLFPLGFSTLSTLPFSFFSPFFLWSNGLFGAEDHLNGKDTVRMYGFSWPQLPALCTKVGDHAKITAKLQPEMSPLIGTRCSHGVISMPVLSFHFTPLSDALFGEHRSDMCHSSTYDNANLLVLSHYTVLRSEWKHVC